jgi:predicted Zn-dependent protease
MNKRVTRLALAAALVVSVALTGAAVEPAPVPVTGETDKGGAEKQLGQAYDMMNRGEQLWMDGDLRAAQESYVSALGVLEKLEVEYPGWGTHVVRSRILACQSAVEKIRDGKPAEAARPAAAGDSNALAEVSFALSPDSAQTAMRALRAGIEERDDTIRELREEIVDLKETNRKWSENAQLVKGKKGDAEPGLDMVTYPLVLKTEARRMLESGAASNAVVLLKEMRVLFPDDRAVNHLLGVAYCRMGEFEKALAEIDPLTRKKTASADEWMTMGVTWLGMGNLGKARSAFESALDKDPNLPEAHFNLAQILIRLKNNKADLARTHYLTAVQLGAKRDQDLEYIINQSLLNEQAGKMKK